MRGKVLKLPSCFFVDQDHPRLCGEKGSRRFEKTEPAGSPPPMRGKAAYEGNGIVGIRITPAYAGKSLFQSLEFQRQ